ncbi:QacE family quaternary ammonium compound efflux SMR transporter [Helicobacter sp. 16-1353]|uniref:DMT family transporter n=1 Tax=Helicobacter sp. 16-1353 TaxID=2004996 RepID=UPI000DCAF6A1|nr:SMR family transporter [Helicobacter sp. 16-1353]RAX54066.1 QacE family quaternary ammonium compound efflux SMR transporter [Helicobacter sp. 16-1353]
MSVYLLIIIASAFLDICANLLLKKSNGFKHKIFGFGAVFLVIVAFILLSFTLEYFPLSVAYSTWGAVGILGTCIGGYLLYNEKLNAISILGIVVVIFAVILLNF